jgi:hypothetical protein
MSERELIQRKKSEPTAQTPSPLEVRAPEAPVTAGLTADRNEGMAMDPAKETIQGPTSEGTPVGHDIGRIAIFGPSGTPSAAPGTPPDGLGGDPGVPLPGEFRARFEQSLGVDLGKVRIHTEPGAAQTASSLRARAFAFGQHIYFGAGRYDEASLEGRRRLAHEVAHTVQQRGAHPATQHEAEVSVPGDASEREADRAADAMIRGEVAVVTSGGDLPMVARDADQDLADAGWAGAEYGGADAKVSVIMGHTTTADQNEAKAIIQKIETADKVVAKHPTTIYRNTGGIGPMKGLLAENVQARFVLEQYLSIVSESGDFLSEYAASYQKSKRDYGEFMGLWNAFEAAGGTLKAGSQSAGMAALSSDPEFLRARNAVKEIRNDLATDRNRIKEGGSSVEKSKAELTSVIFKARSAAANATAKKKQTELDTLNKSISEMVSVIMTVGKMAATATTGVMAMGSGGLDISTLVETNPEIAPGSGPAPSPLAPPDVRRFAAPGTDLNPAPALPEEGLGQPGDVRTYDVPRTYGIPTQTVDTAKGLAAQGVSLLGGPEKMLTTAFQMLEKANIDKLQGLIEAAQEEGNLSDAAASAADMKAKRMDYQEKLTTLKNNVGSLLDHKKQMDTEINLMVAAAKKRGASKDLTGSLRLLGAGDKFLSQIDLTIDLGKQQQAKGKEAEVNRYNINEGAFLGKDSKGNPVDIKHAQGPGQLHYWTVEKPKGVEEYVATKNLVTLQASGKDSLQSGNGRNSTQFDVGKSLEELDGWRKDVTTKRDQAQDALGVGPAASKAK